MYCIAMQTGCCMMGKKQKSRELKCSWTYICEILKRKFPLTYGGRFYCSSMTMGSKSVFLLIIIALHNIIWVWMGYAEQRVPFAQLSSFILLVGLDKEPNLV